MEKIVFTEDKLKRKELAQKYVKVLRGISDAYTIALDAPWGSGKSKLIDFICEEFDKENDIYVKYNAWENDYTNEPFISLVNHIFNTIQENNIPEEEIKKLKDISIKASKVAGKSLVKGIGNFFLGSNSIEELELLTEEITKSFISDTTEYASSIFDNLDESKKSRDLFVSELKETVKNLLERKHKNKIYIVIDELDRCKPTFAIELLEHIKHLFEMNEIIFFIAVDNTQLVESLKVVYGAGFDSKTYLHRFFNIELHLDIPNRSIGYINERLSALKCHDNIGLDSLKYGYDFFGLTLRDIERIITETRIIKALNDEAYIDLSIIFPLLICKYKFNDIYNEIVESYDDFFSKVHDLIVSKDNKRLEKFICLIANSFFEDEVEQDFSTYRKHKLRKIVKNQIKMIEKSSLYQ